MRLHLVSLAVVAGSLLPTLGRAQDQLMATRRFELTALVGGAHSARPSRLVGEDWAEPYAGLRLDVRLWSTGAGTLGFQVFADQSRFGLDTEVAPCVEQCVGIAILRRAKYHEASANRNVGAGITYQRAVTRVLALDAGLMTGQRDTCSERSLQGQVGEGYELGDCAPGRLFVGGEVGASILVRSVVAGLAVQRTGPPLYASGVQAQTRMALRLGYAIR